MRQRRALAAGERERLSVEICARAITVFTHVNLQGQHVALYRPLPDELQPATFERWLASRGARLCYPRIMSPRERSLEFVEANPWAGEDWENGPFGILQPVPRLAALAPAALAWLVVPGVVFGPHGERQGLGAGFYDRFLPQARAEALRLALAFDFQVVSALEQKPWDQPVHWVLTETRDLRVHKSLIEKLTQA